MHNDDSYIRRNVHKQAVGGIVKFGFYVEPVKHLYIDLFTDYLYQQIHFSKWMQIGGLKVGGGVGFCF